MAPLRSPSLRFTPVSCLEFINASSAYTEVPQFRVRDIEIHIVFQIDCCLTGRSFIQNNLDSIEQAKADILQAVSQQKVNEKVVVIQPQEAEESPKEETVIPPVNNTIRHDESALFPASIRKLVAGMARVDRDLFATKFDIGVPLNPTTPGNKDVLILYNSENALPDQFDKYQEDVPHLNIKSATKHCHTMKVVLTEPSQQKQCLAIMGQWESYVLYYRVSLMLGCKLTRSCFVSQIPCSSICTIPAENGWTGRRNAPSQIRESSTWREW